jgi:hypothetical protein
MARKKPKKKEVKRKKAVRKRHLWHSYFDAALLLGAAVALIFWFLDVLSPSGIVMLSSMCASLVVLTHKYRHHLTTLGTITSSYIVSVAAMFAIVWLLRLGSTPPFNEALFLLITLTMLLYWLNLFHPPAVTFAMAYTLFFRGAAGYIFVLFAALVVFIAVRLVIYTLYEHLDINDFFKEFAREEEEIVKREAERI